MVGRQTCLRFVFTSNHTPNTHHPIYGGNKKMNDGNHLLGNLLGRLMSDESAAADYSQGPASWLADEIGDTDISQVQMGSVISDTANSLNIDQSVTETWIQQVAPAAPAAAAGAPAAAAPAAAAPAAAPAAAAPVTLSTVEQNFNSVLTEVHGGNTEITENIVNNGTSFDIDVDGDVGGGDGYFDDGGEVDIHIDNDVTNANALGDGSVAAGGNVAGAATGEGAIAVGGNAHGVQANSGDGAVQIDGANQGAVNTGVNTGIIADGNVTDANIGDGNTTVDHAENVVSGDNNVVTDVEGFGNTVGDGNVAVDTGGFGYGGGGDAVVGDGNATIQGSSDVNAGFGSGDVTDLSGANISGSNVALGDQSTIQDNDVAITETTEGSFNTDTYTEDVDIDVVQVHNDESINNSFTDDDGLDIDAHVELESTDVDVDHGSISDAIID